ncbi:MAG: mechanosensitive ion channel family protein [Dermatophilaceae bacterium]
MGESAELTADLASTADSVITPAVQILGILLAAIVLRWLLHRVIDRVVRSASQRRTDRIAALPGRAGRALAGVTGLANERYVQRTQTMGAVLRSIVTIVVATVALLMVMAIAGIPLAPLLTSVGIGGVALGFGAQSLVKDFLSGIFMIVEDQYGVGDVIDTATTSGIVTGTVEDVTLRVTMVRDASGIMWYIRNGEMTRVGNRSQGWSTASVDLPIAYTEDIQRAIDVIKSAIAGLESEPTWAERVLEKPTVAGVESMAAGVVLIQVTVRCSPNDNYSVQREIRRRVKAAFDREGIDMAAAPAGPSTGGPA